MLNIGHLPGLNMSPEDSVRTLPTTKMARENANILAVALIVIGFIVGEVAKANHFAPALNPTTILAGAIVAVIAFVFARAVYVRIGHYIWRPILGLLIGMAATILF